MKVLDQNNEEIDLRQDFDDDDDMGLTPVDDGFDEKYVNDSDDMEGYSIDPDSEENSIFASDSDDDEEGEEEDFGFEDDAQPEEFDPED